MSESYEKILDGVIGQLNDAVGGLKKATALANLACTKANEEKAASRKAREEAITAIDSVKVREEIVSKKEKGILSAEALATQKDAVESQSAFLANAKRAFEKECIEKRGQIKQELSDIAVRNKVLDDATVKLAKDREKYKQEILKEFAKGAGK